jgi:hypothetical protein
MRQREVKPLAEVHVSSSDYRPSPSFITSVQYSFSIERSIFIKYLAFINMYFEVI